MGFEPMTSAMPVHCSTNWAIKPATSWLSFRNCLRAPVRKNQTYRGKGGKFDFFHILMSDRQGYN